MDDWIPIPVRTRLRWAYLYLRHWLAHRLRLNDCVPFDWTDAEGHHCGARCATCGQVHPETIVTFTHRS